MRNRETVLNDIKLAVTQERQSQLRVLHLMREIESDGHYLEMGYASLFEFATQALGYSTGSAFRRIQSMRLLKALPELESKIEEGTLSLCVAAKTQSFFKQEDQKRKREGQNKLSTSKKHEIAASMLGASTRECEKRLAEISPESALPLEKSRPLAQGKTLIQFSASAELMEKLERLKGLLAHQNPDASYEGLIEILAESALKKLGPKKPAVSSVDDAQTVSIPPLEIPRSRYIAAETKRQVRERDGAHCTYQDEKSGRRCESRYGLEFDHITPFAWGGSNEASNLRIRCRQHNAYTARKMGLIRETEDCEQ